MTDVALFDGLAYDPTEAVDHFFSDQLRALTDRPRRADRSPRLQTSKTQRTVALHQNGQPGNSSMASNPISKIGYDGIALRVYTWY
jgi:hypothetical protein